MQRETVSRNPVHPCPRPGCTREFSTIKDMNAHIVNDHSFSRSCPYDKCPNLPPFTTWARSDGHRRDVHDGAFNSPEILCIYPGIPACRNPEKLWIPHCCYRHYLETLHNVTNSSTMTEDTMARLEATLLSGRGKIGNKN
ncbi:hypothetical protein BDV19DRAFT_234803 [Aspergillus venezuelensis]